MGKLRGYSLDGKGDGGGNGNESMREMCPVEANGIIQPVELGTDEKNQLVNAGEFKSMTHAPHEHEDH